MRNLKIAAKVFALAGVVWCVVSVLSSVSAMSKNASRIVSERNAATNTVIDR